MKIIDRKTGEEKVFENRRTLLIGLLGPIKNEFTTISDTLKCTVKKYRNAPLVPYHMTEEDLKDIAEDLDKILDIPRYHVPGYDKEVCSASFEVKIRDEFYNRFLAEDKVIIRLINKKNDTYKIIL